MAALTVLAPVTGTVVDVSEVDDPVFAAGLVGPGLAIEPDGVRGTEAVAPIAGKIVKLHPHAFVVQHDDGRAVLVHLGIDTVKLGGEGFTTHVSEGDVVQRGTVLVTWDPAAVRDGGKSAVCPVVALEASADVVDALAQVGTAVEHGEDLLTWA
ncbi:PTS glucose transporter subunit IIA [Isoptericola sp. NEAU-Y5]|uniref:PTS glucose transporter subunit IIA n=1 Tax=Isoptericola luteus TaxID=2879484 RepID=A0ABS7ZDQ5_9MICO|nr:PTS glucose transporter subunit IIA [Isoptericola sp. NEAU-Y5]MCA5891964.1 PTS glucose transporter subunit IIA [Isoptericola sp. NEAU-Y5]